MEGLRGAKEGFGAFVDLTALVGVFYKYIFLVAYGYDSRWFFPIILFLLGLILELVFGALIAAVLIKKLGVPEWTLWMAGVFLLWPVAILLGFYVSWFGLLS
jgi:hypothetical protein